MLAGPASEELRAFSFTDLVKLLAICCFQRGERRRGISWACAVTGTSFPVRSKSEGMGPIYSFPFRKPVSGEAGNSPSVASAPLANSRTRLQGPKHPGKEQPEQPFRGVLKRGSG